MTKIALVVGVLVATCAPLAWAQEVPPTQAVKAPVAPAPAAPNAARPHENVRARRKAKSHHSTKTDFEYLSPPEMTTELPSDREVYSSPHSAIAPPIAEALNILAEIAVDKAKRQGLTLLHAQLEKDICGLHAGANHSLFPATCLLVKNSSLERLVGASDAIAAAVTQDLLGDLSLAVEEASFPEAFSQPLRSQLDAVLGVAIDATIRSVARRKPTFTIEDAWSVATVLVNGPLAQRAGAAGKALLAARTCLIDLKEDTSAVCDILDALDVKIADPVYRAAADMALDASQMLFALQSSTIANPAADPVARLRAAVRLTRKVAVAAITDGCGAAACTELLRRVNLVGDVLEAAVDQSQPRLISSAADLLSDLLVPDAKDKGGAQAKLALKKTALVLTAVSQYAATYTTTPSADQAAALHDSRKKILEDLIDATTDRGHRQDDWVASVGAPVGFAARLKSTVWHQPQLSLPMGFSIQRLPGDADKPDEWGLGFHLMLSVIDLGQFLAYSSDGKTPSPTWDTAAAPGVQIGFLVGPAANAFVVGLDGRYARDPLDPAGKHATQALVFVGYYVSFFDFN